MGSLAGVPCAPAKWSSSDEAAVGALAGLVADLDWTSGAMRPAGLLTVVREARARGAAQIVECGCGLSSVVLARLAARIGGSLTALEHDAGWAERVRAELAVDGLEAHARVVHAPLAPHPLALTDGGWYEAGAVADALDDERIDVLLVDGRPPTSPATRSRATPRCPPSAPAWLRARR